MHDPFTRAAYVKPPEGSSSGREGMAQQGSTSSCGPLVRKLGPLTCRLASKCPIWAPHRSDGRKKGAGPSESAAERRNVNERPD
jgi:hypothetical protein